MQHTYLSRVASFEAAAGQLKQRYNRYALLRLALFVLAIGLDIYLWMDISPLAGAVFIPLFIYGFYRFVLWHQDIQERERHCSRLAQVNRWEAAAQEYDYSAFPDGAAFLDAGHPNALDLDLFGPWSFFQYANRAGTALGQQRLAAYLQHPASSTIILERQQALAELSGYLEWRQHFQAHGLEMEDSLQHIALLQEWLAEPPFVSNNRWMVAALYVAPFWALGALLLFIYFLPWYAALLLLLPSAWLIKHTKEQVDRAHLQTTEAEKTLARYARLIAQIESKDFQSPLLQRWQAEFKEGGARASQAIRRLSYIIGQLNVRYNVFAVFLNLGGLWDLQWAYKLERWKAQMHGRLPAWFEALAEFEALSSFANLHYNSPDWAFPTLSDGTAVEAQAMGHPLIPSGKRVCNDILIPTQGHIKLITGSNMAGKSTFLRTVGLNMVLAMAGAPVCARRFALPPLQVFTSMRTQDDLHESTSSFYAELKRLKFIIEAVEAASGEPRPDAQPFFLLDEILKGTNSKDRHTGSKALIQQLIRSRGSGIIATHDLELGQLEAQSAGAIENLCIEVEIRGGQLFFDYKLKKGVSQSFNATLLMQQMGIKIEAE
jgi:hypothetical protein